LAGRLQDQAACREPHGLNCQAPVGMAEALASLADRSADPVPRFAFWSCRRWSDSLPRLVLPAGAC
jgi:hypothetical protein